MFRWIDHNKDWLFSGGGVVFLVGVWGLFKAGYRGWKQRRDVAVSSVNRRHVQYEKIMSKGLLETLPAFLLRPFIRPLTIASRVNIDLRGDTPIALSLSSEVPHLEMYFEITNLSQFDLVLDRMVVEVWFGQPTFTAAVLRRYLIPAGEITRNIYLRQTLTSQQREQIEQFKRPDQNRGSLHIVLGAYFESSLGGIEVSKSIERRTL